MPSFNIKTVCPNNNNTCKTRNIGMHGGINNNNSMKNATKKETRTTHTNINGNNAGLVSAASSSPCANVAKGLSCEENTYLAEVIGEALTKCLSQLAESVPADPIEWIAHWLYNHVNVKRYHQEKATFLADLEEARIELQKIDAERKFRLKNMKDEKRVFKKTLGGGSPDEMDEMDDFSKMYLRLQDAHAHAASGSLDSDQKKKRLRGMFSRRPSSSYMFDSPEMPPPIASPKKTASGCYLHEDGTRFTAEEMQVFQKVREEDKKVREEKKIRHQHRERIPSPPRSESGRYLHADGTHFTDEEMIEFQQKRIEDDNRRQIEKRQRQLQALNSPPRSASGRYLHKDGRPYTDDEVKAFQKARLKAMAAEWGVNCRLALVCRHPLLGDMQARPPMMYPDTPERWEKQGYSQHTLYDHEVYSRDTHMDEPDPRWEGMDALTLHEIVHTGPWIASGYATHAKDTFTDAVCGVKSWVTGGM